jgi:antibiotic biosynthesis monooxygenase (ABM) superfamily enzyme
MSSVSVAAPALSSAPAPAPAARFSRPRFALLVLLGVYPLITALLYVVLPLTEGWQIWHRTLVIAPIMVATMIGGLIPAVQTRFRRFLHPAG